jgi:hypothetical protein
VRVSKGVDEMVGSRIWAGAECGRTRRVSSDSKRRRGERAPRSATLRLLVMNAQLQLTFRSGAVTSGRMLMNGRTSSRKRTGTAVLV